MLSPISCKYKENAKADESPPRIQCKMKKSLSISITNTQQIKYIIYMYKYIHKYIHYITRIHTYISVSIWKIINWFSVVEPVRKLHCPNFDSLKTLIKIFTRATHTLSIIHTPITHTLSHFMYLRSCMNRSSQIQVNYCIKQTLNKVKLLK